MIKWKDSMIYENSINLTPKQNLILLFVETGFADTEYKLIRHLDRSAFFPSNLDENLRPLFKYSFIEISKRSNGHPCQYRVTEQGIKHLDRNLSLNEVMAFADTYVHKDFIDQWMPVLLQKRF